MKEHIVHKWQQGHTTVKQGTCEDHGGSLGHQESHHEVSHLALPHGQHSSILSVTLLATIPAEVVVVAVVVVLPVGVVPLLVVGYQVMQREAIVCHYEVDTLVRMPAAAEMAFSIYSRDVFSQYSAQQQIGRYFAQVLDRDMSEVLL